MKSRFLALSKENILVTVLMGLGFAYRLVYILWGKLPPVIYDATSYSDLAVSLLTSGKFWIGGEPFAFYTPMYSWFLTAVYWLFGVENYHAVRIVQVVLSTINLWLVYRLVRDWLGSKVALVSLVVAVIYSPFIFANSLVLTETLYSTVLLIWLNWLFKLLHRGGGWPQWLLFGNLWGVMLLIRPITGLFLPSLFILYLLGKTKLFNLFSKAIPNFRQLVLTSIGVIIVLSPWIVRNYLTFQKFIPFSAEAGNVFLLGTYKDYSWESDQLNWPIGKTAIETDSLKIQYGLGRISNGLKDDPIGYSWWYLSKFKYFWFFPYFQGSDFLPSKNIQFSAQKILSWLCFVGILISIKDRNKFSKLILTFLTYLTLIHMVFMTLDRLAFPTEYLVIALGSYTLLKVWDLAKSPLMMINWKRQLSIGGLITILINIILFNFITNDRLNHYSLLQYLKPEYAFFGTLIRKGIWLILGVYFSYLLCRIFLKGRMRIFSAYLIGFIIYQISSGLLSTPRLYDLPVVSSTTYSKIIDRPNWDNEREWTLLINLVRIDHLTTQAGIEVTVNGTQVRKMSSNEIGGGGWINFGNVRWQDGMIRVDIRGTGDGGIRLYAQKDNNFGLSLLDGKFGELSPNGDLKNGSYEIGITSGDGYRAVPIWYGSSRYEVRQRLLTNLKSNGETD